MKQDRDGERVAAAAAAAARAAVAPLPAANYAEAAMPPTAFMTEAEARLALDTAGADINDAAELQVAKDTFTDGDLRYLAAHFPCPCQCPVQGGVRDAESDGLIGRHSRSRHRRLREKRTNLYYGHVCESAHHL